MRRRRTGYGAVACVLPLHHATCGAPQLLDEMEVMLAPGGNVVDFHSCELFPERWFDLVLVLRTDNKLLFDRLVARSVLPSALASPIP